MVRPIEFKEFGQSFSPEILYDAEKMEKTDDLASLDVPIAKQVSAILKEDQETKQTISYDENSLYEIDGKEYETDDTGQLYKEEGKLLPNNQYVAGSGIYETDENSRITSFEATLESTPNSERDLDAQKEVGGKDRLENDDGGHLIARIFGGASGLENLVPMRNVINRGDYKQFENGCANDLKEGHDVNLKGEIVYPEGSDRPSEIKVEKEVDGKKAVEGIFYNDEGSIEGLDEVKDSINKEDYESLENRIDSMEEYGEKPTITSVIKKYDADGKPSEITVTVRNETTGFKTPITFKPEV
ncbi:DNA/RNA non-specific endonuclease [Ligilactobacillus faecis]|uniref:DNA/RNA non-specific endonuclease n=1 Tax=Ligilactobacillus faecis TaxID=762833 RepID=UPI002468A3FD|nr:DNA/RNA non-specific endonuclease [Ligilactobacillus faecis]WGN89907.1 DNA/RNA non-specific endonuclease [Ligilactobacillus faecis]